MSVLVDPTPIAAVRFLDASMTFHTVIERPDHAMQLPNYHVRRLSPKVGRGR